MKKKLIALILITISIIAILEYSLSNKETSNILEDNYIETAVDNNTSAYVKIKYNTAILGKRAKENMGKKAYEFYKNILIPGVVNRDKEIKIPNGITEKEKSLITSYFQQNCPLEYFSGTPFFNVKGDTIMFDYSNCINLSNEEYKYEIDKLSTSIEQIINTNVKKNYNYFETILALYKYLSQSTTYNINAKSTDAYGVLVYNEGICGGFSQAMQILLAQLDLDEGYQVEWIPEGDDKDGHVWNALMIDGKWYYFDATWENGTTDGNGLVYFAMDIDRRDLGELPRDEYTMCPLGLEIDMPNCYDDRFSILQYCTYYNLDLDNHKLYFKNEEDNKWYSLNTENLNINEK